MSRSSADSVASPTAKGTMLLLDGPYRSRSSSSRTSTWRRNCLQTFDSLISFRENCQDGCMLEMRKYMEWLRELCEYECNCISLEQKDFQHWEVVRCAEISIATCGRRFIRISTKCNKRQTKPCRVHQVSVDGNRDT